MLYNLANTYDVDKFKEKARSLISRCCIVELTEKKRNRTIKQNSYLHLILSYFASEIGLSLEEVKLDFFKRKVNNEIFEEEVTNKRGKKIIRLRSSSELDTSEMTIAIERFRNWSSSVANIYLPSPNEQDALIYAMQQIEANKEYL